MTQLFGGAATLQVVYSSVLVAGNQASNDSLVLLVARRTMPSSERSVFGGTADIPTLLKLRLGQTGNTTAMMRSLSNQVVFWTVAMVEDRVELRWLADWQSWFSLYVFSQTMMMAVRVREYVYIHCGCLLWCWEQQVIKLNESKAKL
jgi:hypothetical protein